MRLNNINTASVLDESFILLGTVELSDEELTHFSSTGSAAAKVCLSPEDIARLGIDEDDYVYIRES